MVLKNQPNSKADIITHRLSKRLNKKCFKRSKHLDLKKIFIDLEILYSLEERYKQENDPEKKARYSDHIKATKLNIKIDYAHLVNTNYELRNIHRHFQEQLTLKLLRLYKNK